MENRLPPLDQQACPRTVPRGVSFRDLWIEYRARWWGWPGVALQVRPEHLLARASDGHTVRVARRDVERLAFTGTRLVAVTVDGRRVTMTDRCHWPHDVLVELAELIGRPVELTWRYARRWIPPGPEGESQV